MRIFLLPITTRQALIYCQTSARQSTAPLSYVDRITNKATQTWAKWEDADKGWQKTVVKYGNAGLQRIPFQEWGLKSFPPAKPELQAEHLANNKQFDVCFPGNVMREEDVPKTLLRLARERKTLHWNRFIGSMIAMPIAIPFALVPVYAAAAPCLLSRVAHI
jgi:Mitochondrial K+-H+ exchange-related